MDEFPGVFRRNREQREQMHFLEPTQKRFSYLQVLTVGFYKPETSNTILL